ncbi:MAG: hypothetical protein LW808_001920 [Verrucomicrobiota bacterium]|nr:MAG: hypothetical protein LW808_001920 [Verrucomicrobiota bacterium]
MSYIDFNNLYEQLGSKYAEVQKAVTRWRTSSETVQAGEYEFTITTLPASEDFWSSSKVLISSKPLQKSTMQTALVASNRNEVQKLLQDPVQVKDILKLFALIHSADCSTLRGQQEILGALNALKWTAYEDPTTPEIFRKVLKKQAISVLLPNIELLESTFELMNSIDPLKLKKDDVATMTALRETVDDPKTPLSLKEAAKQKVVDVSIAINPKAIECDYAIPANIVDKICSDKNGAYAVRYNAPMEGFRSKTPKR